MLAQFGGSAWTLDEATAEYWYHSFLPEQPDLDWRNPSVRAAMLDVLRFWFSRGIDGFRPVHQQGGLAQVVEHQCGEYNQEPGAANRCNAEMS